MKRQASQPSPTTARPASSSPDDGHGEPAPRSGGGPAPARTAPTTSFPTCPGLRCSGRVVLPCRGRRRPRLRPRRRGTAQSATRSGRPPRPRPPEPASLMPICISSASSSGAGSQPTTSRRPTRPPIAAARRSTFTGSMPCVSSTAAAPSRRPGNVRLEDVQRAGRAAARRRVHQHDRLVAVEEGVGQVEAADAEIDHAHLRRGSGRRGQALDDLDAEGVVAQEDVADAGDRGCGGGPCNSPSSRDRVRRFVDATAPRSRLDSFHPTMSNDPFTGSLSRSVPPRATTGRMRNSD